MEENAFEKEAFNQGTDSTDQINSSFYKRFPYPWPPIKYSYLTDPHFEIIMLNQSIGDWQHRTIPSNPRIWVAGCGTNQAIFTALRFPTGTVIASDLSTAALSMSATVASNLNIQNLELREESINHVSYDNEFDYLICTGVIHHMANPQQALHRLSTALKPSGILELMVYNKYHRIATSAFQKAIRILCDNQNVAPDKFDTELSFAQKLINTFTIENQMNKLLSQYKDCPESMLAYALLQPVEHSYTLADLQKMATAADMELVCPCINPFDKADDTFSWNMNWDDLELQDQYNLLPDPLRWQVTNHLLLNESPMLWFYSRCMGQGQQRKTEQQICEEFLETRFEKANTLQRNYMLSDDGNYKLSKNHIPFPIIPPGKPVRQVYDLIDPTISMRELFQRLGIENSFPAVNKVRLELTTSLFPYLKAVQSLF